MTNPQFKALDSGELQRSDAGFIISPYLLTHVRGELELPYGWLEDGRLDKRVAVSFFDGDDEDMLGDDGAGAFATRLETVVVRCITQLGPISVPRYERTQAQQDGLTEEYRKLTAPDRFFILLAIRRATHGDTYEFNLVCQNQACKKDSLQSVDLSTFAIYPAKEPLKRTEEVVLPFSGKQVIYRPLTGLDEKRIEAVVTSNPSAMLSVSLWGRIVSANGEKVPSWADLKRWHAGDRDALRKHMMKTVVGLDMETIVSICPHCKTDNRTQLAIDAGFFLPSSVGLQGRSTAGENKSS